MTPVISFTGWSGSGKTTFIEKLIPVLRERGLRVGVLKRDGHDFDMDREGKDTWRFTRAGAEAVAITNDAHAAILENRPVGTDELLSRLNHVDIILAEGLVSGRFPLIEVYRADARGLRCPEPERLAALVSDEETGLPVPRFGTDEAEEAAAFILSLLPPALGEKKGPLPAPGSEKPRDKAVRLFMGGRELPLAPAAQKMLREANLEILRALLDAGEEDIPDIRIDMI